MHRIQLIKTLTLKSQPFLSRFKSHDPYDPPFTPIPKPPKKTQNPNPKTPQIPLKSDLPFDFQYSYSESNPDVKPIVFREPTRLYPFGPGRLDRKWDGISAKFGVEVEKGRVLREREEVLGDPLTEEEVEELVERYGHNDCSRQINLARIGVYVNVVERVREAFKSFEVVRLDCSHVETSDCKKIGVKLRVS